MKTKKIDCYGLWDVLEYIECENIEKARCAILTEIFPEAFPFIYLRDVTAVLNDNEIGFNFNRAGNEPGVDLFAVMNKFCKIPIDILG